MVALSFGSHTHSHTSHIVSDIWSYEHEHEHIRSHAHGTQPFYTNTHTYRDGRPRLTLHNPHNSFTVVYMPVSFLFFIFFLFIIRISFFASSFISFFFTHTHSPSFTRTSVCFAIHRIFRFHQFPILQIFNFAF